MSDTTHVTFRAPAAVLRRLAELCEGRGTSRSGAIVAAVMSASDPGDLPDVVTEHEALVLLSEAARAGT